MYRDQLLKHWIGEQRPQAPKLKNGPAFYQNLEQAMDSRRQTDTLLGLKPRCDEDTVDFTSSDFLGLSRGRRLREAFLEELSLHPKFNLSSGGSHVHAGNYDYLMQTEQEIAAFYDVESAHLTQSGFAANVAVLAGVPLPGDAIVYDELVHASSHEGLHLSRAEHKIPFRHNDADSLRDALIGLKQTHPAFATGTRSILICVESIYSMDGDVAPLADYIQIVKDEFPLGNAQFVVDEAHSVGVLGAHGRGFVSLLGLDKDIAIQIHVASKALGAIGGVILSNKTVRSMLLNHARSLTFSSAPSFPITASIWSAYRLLIGGETAQAQDHLQKLVKHFFQSVTSSPLWEEAMDEGLLTIPLLEDWEQRPFQTHIVPLRTRPNHEKWLSFHLLRLNINAYPLSFPIVPKGESRVRLIFNAHHTFEQVDHVVAAICSWLQEMLDIEHGDSENTLPNAARQAYALQTSLAA